MFLHPDQLHCEPSKGHMIYLLTNLGPDYCKAPERDMFKNINYTYHHKMANMSGPDFTTHRHFENCIKQIPVSHCS